MKFWISKNSEVSVREQIVTQVRLGVASRDLLPGERLVSTRAFARRFGIHANTVAAAYQELAADEVVELRKGSGVFISAQNGKVERPQDVDALFASFLSDAQAAGYSRPEIDLAIDRWRSRGHGESFILVESDDGLRSIIHEEITSRTGLKIECTTLEDFAASAREGRLTVVALFDEKDKLQPLLKPGQKAVFIEANSVPASIRRARKPSENNLIAVVSCWHQFLAFARIYLLAAKIDPDALIIRSTNEASWDSGLEAAAVIVCDSFTATRFGDDDRLRVFRLITDASLEQLTAA